MNYFIKCNALWDAALLDVSSWSWTQDGQDERTYVFGYDGLHRLVSTVQYKGPSLENKYGEDLAYDRNGNITALVRRNGSATPVSTQFSYDGNKHTLFQRKSCLWCMVFK